MQTTRPSMDDNGVHPKRPGREVEDEPNQSNEVGLSISRHLVVSPRCYGQCFCLKLPLKMTKQRSDRQGPKRG